MVHVSEIIVDVITWYMVHVSEIIVDVITWYYHISRISPCVRCVPVRLAMNSVAPDI